MDFRLCLNILPETYGWPREFSWRSFLVCLTVGFVSSVLAGSGAQAGGLYINEFVTPSMGTAGAGSEAWADNASTAFHNPAGMTRLDRDQLLVGGGLIAGDIKFDADSDTPFSGGDGGQQAGLGPILSLHYVAEASETVKFGVSLVSISGAVLDPNNDWAGRFQVQDINLLTLSVKPSIAFKVTDNLSLGGGPSIMYSKLEYELAALGPRGRVEGDIDIDVDGIDVGFHVGALLELTDRTRLGVRYFSEVDANLSGDTDIDPPGFDVDTDLELPFVQGVRLGGYHEINDQWALLGTVGWEDWSALDDIVVSTPRFSNGIPRDWQDTYHFSGGVHYRPTEDWLLQTGVTYDTSPVDEDDRTADMPIDRQIRFAVGAQYEWNEDVTVGGSFVYANYGDAEIDSAQLKGEYDKNNLFFFALNLGWKF